MLSKNFCPVKIFGSTVLYHPPPPTHTHIINAHSYTLTSYHFIHSLTHTHTHTLRCAGLIAAVANNSVCGVGVAYGAQVSGLRILDGTVTDLLEGRSFIYKAHINWIYSCSWGPEDNGMSVEGPGYIAKVSQFKRRIRGRGGGGGVALYFSIP